MLRIINRLRLFTFTKGLNISLLFFLGIIIAIFTFPSNGNWSYSPGIDSSLVWVFNYLYEVDWEIGQNFIFPHGPLAFFMYPTHSSVVLANGIISLLKILLIISVFYSFKGKRAIGFLLAFVITYIISIISGFNHLLIATLVFSYCAYYNSGYRYFKVLALLLTSFALFVKAYVGIISIIISISFISYSFIKKRSKTDIINDLLLISLSSLLIWSSLYKSLNGFLDYLIGITKLAEDNSSAASYYPDNNWVFLSLFIISLFLIIIINRSNRSYYFFGISGLSLFAAWKHGMAREDLHHQKGLMVFIIILVFAYLLFEPKKKIINLILGSIALLFFILNITNALNSSEIKYKFNKASNFVEFISSYEELKQASLLTSTKNIESEILPSKVREEIDSAFVDVYPWDYTVIQASNLNWNPRIVIQSYAAYTPWLDNKNAEHFKSNNTPEYFLWKRSQNATDKNGNQFYSIDNRYLLNDEPNSLLSIISNYKLIDQTEGFLIYKRNDENGIKKKEIKGRIESNWGEWIDVPESAHSLLRARLYFKKSLLQRLKSFTYKDEQFWIYLKLNDGRIHKYRIVPKNAEEGLWIAPYVFNDQALKVNQIMFLNSNNRIINQNLKIEWEGIEFEEALTVEKFFDLKKNNLDDELKFEYESKNKKWKEVNSFSINQEDYNTIGLGNKSNYALSFSYELDSIELGKTLSIELDTWLKTVKIDPEFHDKIVISISNQDSTLVWKRFNTEAQSIDKTKWEHYLAHLNYKHLTENCILKIYIRNKKKGHVLLANPKIRIY